MAIDGKEVFIMKKIIAAIVIATIALLTLSGCEQPVDENVREAKEDKGKYVYLDSDSWVEVTIKSDQAFNVKMRSLPLKYAVETVGTQEKVDVHCKCKQCNNTTDLLVPMVKQVNWVCQGCLQSVAISLDFSKDA